MALESWVEPSDLFLARGVDVSLARPVFTGDVFLEVEIPGVQPEGLAIVTAHPCTFRGAGGQLANRVAVAAVRQSVTVQPEKWRSGYYNLFPLPDLMNEEFFAGHFLESAPVPGDSLRASNRVACLSSYGINLLQQRLIWQATRFEVPTYELERAFSHTLVEADLLEEWADATIDQGGTAEDAAASFDTFIRSSSDPSSPDAPTLQIWLKDPQHRPVVRRRMRDAIAGDH